MRKGRSFGGFTCRDGSPNRPHGAFRGTHPTFFVKIKGDLGVWGMRSHAEHGNELKVKLKNIFDKGPNNHNFTTMVKLDGFRRKAARRVIGQGWPIIK